MAKNKLTTNIFSPKPKRGNGRYKKFQNKHISSKPYGGQGK